MTQKTASKIAKGLYAAALTLLGQLSTVLVGSTTLGQVTQGQWVTIGLFTLGAFGGAFGLAAWRGPAHGPLINGSRHEAK